MIKILLVEDHKLVRQAWRNLLLGEKDIVIIGEAETESDAISFVKKNSPDIILLDINLKGGNGSNLIPIFCNILPHPKIIVVSMNTEFSFVKNMFKLGVMGYITKNASFDDMLFGIRQVYAGIKYKSNDLQEIFNDEFTSGIDHPDISMKQIEIIKLIAKGLSNKEIAKQCNISEKTVEGRKTALYKKLQIKNNVGLLKYASDNGFI